MSLPKGRKGSGGVGRRIKVKQLLIVAEDGRGE
jgi:hypothetical protein